MPALYGVGPGMYDALDQIMKQRMEEQVRQEQHRQALADEDARRQQLDLQRQRYATEDTRYQQERSDQNNERGLKLMAADAGEMKRQGILKLIQDPAKRQAAEAQSAGFQDLTPHSFHTPEQEQTEAATAEAAVLDKYRKQKQIDKEFAPPQAPTKDTYGDWQRKYDYELAHPKASTAAGGPAGLQRARAQSAVQMLDRLQEVHKKLQAGEGPGQLVSGTIDTVKGMLNMSNPATEYQKLRRATAVALAVAIQGSRPSDADAEAMSQLLPDFKTPAEVANNLFAASKAQLLDTAENMGGGGPRGGTVNMRAPDGTVKPVPTDQVEHFKSLGATIVP